MPFKDPNVAAGLSKKSAFQVGVSDKDPYQTIEKGLLLPWVSDPESSWVYYECTVGAMLDSGIVVHRQLPQVNKLPDTLASCDFADTNMDQIGDVGVTLKCNDQYQDIVQRMGHARYWFRLWGQALRLGKKVPIPSIKSIGGVAAVPYDRNPQWAYNRIAPYGNFGGAVLWHAQWSLWYTTAVPPTSDAVPAVDPAAHISSGATPPSSSGMQAPYSLPDDNAVASAPTKPQSLGEPFVANK